MPDKFTQATTTGYGSRIGNSLNTVIFGLILFASSFWVLYWNEGVIDTSKTANTAIEINSTTENTDSSLNGKLVSTTGIINSYNNIGDNLFLNPGKFVTVQRKVEMYSWVETKGTRNENNTGGSSTTDTTYTYNKSWEEFNKNSGYFKYPDGHQNPQKSVDSDSIYTGAYIGIYSINPYSLILPKLAKVQLNAQNTTLSKDAVLVNDSYLFISNNKSSTFENPQIGDLRISYYVLKPGFNGTVFGTLNGGSIDPYSDQKGNNLYRLFTGTRSQAISTFHSEYIKWLWILRGIGFLMMWFGLSMLFAPITALLDILPILGDITGFIIGIATFVVALILSVVTIIVSIIIHSLVALVVAVALTIIAIILILIFLRKRKKTRSNIKPPYSPTMPIPPSSTSTSFT